MRAWPLFALAVVALVRCSSDDKAPPPYQDPTGNAGYDNTGGPVKSGTAGAAGAGGSSSGTSGASGASGSSGAAGASGAPGSSGAAGASGSAGSGGAPPLPDDGVTIFNGCEVADYVNLSADGDDRTIVENSLHYTPNCLQISAGESVTWNMDFSTHPLTPGRPGDKTAGTLSGDPDTPIQKTSDGMTVTFVFAETGYFPFYCGQHGFDDGGTGAGMVGVIHVQ